MTFNVLDIPLWYRRMGQRERTCRIPRWIFDNVPDVDVIGFQVRTYTHPLAHMVELYTQRAKKADVQNASNIGNVSLLRYTVR